MEGPRRTTARFEEIGLTKVPTKLCQNQLFPANNPKGRRSLCYDREALASRREFKPKDSATNMAAAMGIDLLSEEQYRELQKLGNFDSKTSSWVKTPSAIRKLGGAIFCDRRYNTVFTYHNGAESYYAGRGFRGSLRV